MNTDKKNKKLAIFITLATIIVLGGITFTFFSSTVSNENNEKFQTETATMRLVFSDNDNGVSGTLNLGESIVKKFTLENTGTVDAYGKINTYLFINKQISINKYFNSLSNYSYSFNGSVMKTRWYIKRHLS